ncbi:MAG: hypothetical protein ABJB05_17395 [Parafilimonas sp.]
MKNLLKNKIEKFYNEQKLICICVNKIDWNKRIIGYIKKVNDFDSIELQVVDEFGRNKNLKLISFKSIKSLETGGIYNETLEKLNKKRAIEIYRTSKYLYSSDKNFFAKAHVLIKEKELCTFFFATEFTIGIIKKISQDELKIINIGYDGKNDGESIFDIAFLTKVRYKSNFEKKVFFLRKSK